MSRILCLSLSFLCLSCTFPPAEPTSGTEELTAQPETQPPIELPPEVPEPLPPPITEPLPQPIPEPVAAAHCDIGPAIEWMANQKIIYTQNPSSEWRDCSGNFLRLSSHVAGMCDVELVAPPGVREYIDNGNNERPGVAQARTTRGIAKWYDDKGTFVPIFYDDVELTEAPDALKAIREKIKPGAVLWFSQRKPLAKDDKDGLYREVGGAIGHMGTVTSVVRDDNGLVTGWEMYHGQNSRKHNGITPHWWEWPEKFTSRGQEYPPGGYWNQRIVGFAESLVPNVDVVALAD